MLRTVAQPPHVTAASARSDGTWTEDSSPSAFGAEPSRPEKRHGSPRERAMPWNPALPQAASSGRVHARPTGELVDLGQFETLPPFEMMEDLHNVYFATQRYFLPIIHPGNYLRSFHSAPHMRPPMCLQYAIWTAASNGHPKYNSYHDALYRRARQYLESDELKGQGEHFITVGHAQAWVLIAGDEARSLLFTRAGMSSARAIRLTNMMGLHRLDNEEDELPMAPMITPPKNWGELEERRRLFWGGYCIDSYASISAGWPTMIDREQITTHLPSSEEAFISGQVEQGCTLQESFRGANYSVFAGNVIICHIFTRLLKHAHRPVPDDHPEDVDFGQFWTRHRDLDNMLSSAFMFLPQRYQLPQGMADPVAVQYNLNLHAAVICLQNASKEKADKYKLPGIRQSARVRCLTAAQEIVDILRASFFTRPREGFRNPLMALSIYFAGSVYIDQAKDDIEGFNKENLEFLLECMINAAHNHAITRAYLQQLLADIERNGISVSATQPPTSNRDLVENAYHSIPVIAQSRHTKPQTPLPGRLPLGAAQGPVFDATAMPFDSDLLCPGSIARLDGDPEARASKRMRTVTGMPRQPPHLGVLPSSWSELPADTVMDPAPDLFEYTDGWSYATKYMINPVTTLPNMMPIPQNNRAAMPPAPTNPTPHFNFSMAGPPSAAAPSDLFSDLSRPIIPASVASGFGLDTSGGTTGMSVDMNMNPDINTAMNTIIDQRQTQPMDTDTNMNPTASAAVPGPGTTALSPDLGDLGIFDLDQHWSVAETFYAMLDLTGTERLNAASQPQQVQRQQAQAPTQGQMRAQQMQSGGDLSAWAALGNTGGGGSGASQGKRDREGGM
ncbi:uncharacterized protein C8A04DRAFT_12022 [Dichotomopilus funicola]|uniref:Xylanolytic transcriptional activator regulatory domain-containing protein n=1 Tax=Dichotomopilus funicola TaxID=1934379 RepID=A0AAN6V2Y1_9PEZI|nr:hypothetical protein C8A04DRAFT_12022 [Dichotomopilus funicola]